MDRRLRRMTFAIAATLAAPATAGIPVDSFNSASAALAPSLAIDTARHETKATRGPVDALVLLAQRSRKSVAAPVANPEAKPDR